MHKPSAVALLLATCLGLGGLGVSAPGCSSPEEDADADADPADLGGGADLAMTPDLRPAIRHRDINHILGTGQSLSVGAAGAPALSTMQPYANLMFNTGVLAGGANLTALVPLVESGVETPSSSMANLVTRMARDEVFVGLPAGMNSHEILISCHGIGGTAYNGLKKGTTAYQNGMAQVTAGMALAKAAGKSYVVRAVTNVHGESDHVAKNAAYGDNLLTWQADYETDVRAMTGQAEPIPMLHTQMSSWTKYNAAQSDIPGLQLKASLGRPDRLVMVGPKYFLSYVADGVHLTNTGYRHLGEYHAKVYRAVVLEGRAWSPLRPLSVRRDGMVLRARFQVPVPPLVLDTTLVTDPGRYGFEFTDEGAMPATITEVRLVGPDEVAVTLSRAPTGRGRLRYAFTGVAGMAAGPRTGPRGNLRDSDATRSRNGDPLYNWCVHFDMAVD